MLNGENLLLCMMTFWLSGHVLVRIWQTQFLVQGLPAAGRVRNLLWHSFREKHSMGDGVSLWSDQWSSVHWKHHEPSRLSSLGSLSIHYPLGSWLHVYDESWVKGRPLDSCKATLLSLASGNSNLFPSSFGPFLMYAHKILFVSLERSLERTFSWYNQ